MLLCFAAFWGYRRRHVRACAQSAHQGVRIGLRRIILPQERFGSHSCHGTYPLRQNYAQSNLQTGAVSYFVCLYLIQHHKCRPMERIGIFLSNDGLCIFKCLAFVPLALIGCVFPHNLSTLRVDILGKDRFQRS